MIKEYKAVVFEKEKLEEISTILQILDQGVHLMKNKETIYQNEEFASLVKQVILQCHDSIDFL